MTRSAHPALLRPLTLLLLGCLCVSVLCAAVPSRPRQRKTASTRTQDDRIYLVHADQLSYDQWRRMGRGPAPQILTGSVAFRHQGASLYCDSAHFYEPSNSFEAFGHVRMYQGDTLSLFSDYGYYDGDAQMMKALYNVQLKNRGTTLYTDSLYYDRLYNQGYFQEGGKLVDKETTLTSDWGEYHTDTKMAIFYYDVHMRNKKFYLTTDSLYYDTNLSLAHIIGPSDIYSGSSHIYSERGYYDTRLEQSRLMDRSVLMNGGKTMVGDSVFYDSRSGQSRAFRNIVFTDTVNKNRLTGNYGEYNDSTGYAMATDSAVAMEFSQRDTLYMHADTFKIFTFNINTDSVYRKIHGYNKVRAYRLDIQAVCDSLVYNTQDSCMTMYRDPIVWHETQQLLGERIEVFMRDSTVDHAHVINQAFSIEQLRDTTLYNQVSSREMFAFFDDKGEIRETQARDNVLIVFYPEDEADSTYTGQVCAESTELRMFMKDRKMERIWMPKTDGTMYPMTQIPPATRFLPNFAWFDYIRPLDRDDIFHWRGKKQGTELKPEPRHEAPLQQLPELRVSAEPAEVSEPAEPAEASEPAEPAEASEPAEPAEASEPAEPVEPTESSEPAESSDPSTQISTE